MNRNLNGRNAFHFALAILLLPVSVTAQQQIGALMTGMAANAKQLKQYTFKQKTETYHKGELKNSKVSEVHYAASGERVTIPLDEQKVQPEPRRRGPGSRIIARKIEEEQEKMKDYIEHLMALTSRYLSADPARLQAAMPNAEVTTGGGTSQVRIAMRDYAKTGDVMTMSFDSESKRPTRTEITTSLDNAPVSIVLTYDQIREGPSYPVKTVIKSDARDLELRLFTYDYRL